MDEIIEKIMNSDNWPSVPYSENLEIINEIANNSFSLNTFEGKFAALLMYHQLIEAMCIHLINDCSFFIELSIYPTTIQTNLPENRMLGYYIDELSKNIEFDGKDEFIKKSKEFNELRNKIVHGITKNSCNEINTTLNYIKTKFDDIYDIYDEIQDWFRSCFHDFKKDVFVDYLEDESE